MRRPLLLPANLPPGAGEADAPRVDFVELARVLGAAVVYPPAKNKSSLSRLEVRTATDLRQAQAARARGGETCVYVSLSEKVGLPLALLGTKGVPHVLVAHHLTSARKRLLQTRTGWLHRFSRIVVVSRSQEAYLRNEVGLPAERVTFAPHTVDATWWGKGTAPHSGGEGVLAVGRERRDYETLAQVARLLPGVPFMILAGSAWAERKIDKIAAPPNMRFLDGGHTFAELRNLYYSAAVVAVPLVAGTDYAAGSTALMEAFACAKPVVVTETPGLAGYAVGEEAACRVPPDDPGAFARALQELSDDPNTVQRTVDDGSDLDAYVNLLARIVRVVAAK